MTKRERELAVEAVLKRWKKLQDEVMQVEEDAASVAFSQGSGEPVQSSSISDKTARGAFMLDSIDEKRKWIQAITDGMNWLDEEQPELRLLLWGHYGMKYANGYRKKYARSFMLSYCAVFAISESEYKSRRWDALSEIAFYATEAGLLRICKQYKSAVNRRKP